jgi:hypothetical protein
LGCGYADKAHLIQDLMTGTAGRFNTIKIVLQLLLAIVLAAFHNKDRINHYSKISLTSSA